MLTALSTIGLQNIPSQLLGILQLRQYNIHKFKAKVELYNEVGPFILKTATTQTELIQAFALRYQVFHHEMIGKTNPYGLDIDDYDFFCDHLIIIEKKSSKLVGTYRLNSTVHSSDFYSDQEFDLSKILALPGHKIELGRACIHKDYRRGSVIALLWRGIAEYMSSVNADILFGCASIKTYSARQAALLYKSFEEEGRIHPDFFAPPRFSYTMPGLGIWIQNYRQALSPEEKKEAQELLPPLCRAYLKIGAYLGGEPAFDKEFNCIDFLTILRREDLNQSVCRKYKLGSEEA